MILKFIAGESLNNNQIIKPEKGVLDCQIIFTEKLVELQRRPALSNPSCIITEIMRWASNSLHESVRNERARLLKAIWWFCWTDLIRQVLPCDINWSLLMKMKAMLQGTFRFLYYASPAWANRLESNDVSLLKLQICYSSTGKLETFSKWAMRYYFKWLC